MPKPEEVLSISSGNYQFSAIKPEELEASEYTLVTVVIDITGSVYAFAKDLLDMLKAVVEACKKNPRSENLMLRVVTFNDTVYETHGFRALGDIEVSDYKDLNCGGMTALYDAVFTSIEATNTYGKSLSDNDFTVNGAVYIITDGADNRSSYTEKMIADVVKKARIDEVMESLVTVLIGINNSQCSQYLQEFQQNAELSQYVDMGDVSASKLAKLAGFISKSISSQSQSLGSGGPSQQVSLTF